MGYRQCKLVKSEGSQTLTRVSWLPEPYGRVGNVLKLRGRGGPWDDGWRVTEAWTECDEVYEHRHLFICTELK